MSFLKRVGGISISSLVIYGGIQNCHNFSKYINNDYHVNKETQDILDGIKDNVYYLSRNIKNIYSMLKTTNSNDTTITNLDDININVNK